jgi:hypothetical protein
MANKTQETDTRVLSVRVPFMRHVEFLNLAAKHGMTPSDYMLYKLWSEPNTSDNDKIKQEINNDLRLIRIAMSPCFNFESKVTDEKGFTPFKTGREFPKAKDLEAFMALRDKLLSLIDKYNTI